MRDIEAAREGAARGRSATGRAGRRESASSFHESVSGRTTANRNHGSTPIWVVRP